MAYNGHKNWSMWNVSLWINNDEVLYQLAQSYIRRYRSKEKAARAMADFLDGQKTLDGANFTYTSIRAAMAGM